MVFEKIRSILAEQFSEDESSITMSTDLAEDLGADSLDLADVLMAIEDEFEVEVLDEDLESIKTVGDIVEYIENNSNND
ncbi:MAG: acyl carrier protein [Clostridia bacterium]|nr:acyl carrier protein [Clostridia bacterium]